MAKKIRIVSWISLLFVAAWPVWSQVQVKNSSLSTLLNISQTGKVSITNLAGAGSNLIMADGNGMLTRSTGPRRLFIPTALDNKFIDVPHSTTEIDQSGSIALSSYIAPADLDYVTHVMIRANMTLDGSSGSGNLGARLWIWPTIVNSSIVFGGKDPTSPGNAGNDWFVGADGSRPIDLEPDNNATGVVELSTDKKIYWYEHKWFGDATSKQSFSLWLEGYFVTHY